MTTLLSSISKFLYLDERAIKLLAFDVVDSVADRLDRLSVLIGDLDVESLSNSMMSSTVSRESAPRSLEKFASGVTSLASQLSFSTMISTTFSLICDMILFLTWL